MKKRNTIRILFLTLSIILIDFYSYSFAVEPKEETESSATIDLKVFYRSGIPYSTGVLTSLMNGAVADLNQSIIQTPELGSGIATFSWDGSLTSIPLSTYNNATALDNFLKLNRGDADIVVVLFESTTTCGSAGVTSIGTLNSEEANVFINAGFFQGYRCLDNHSLAHEIGHIFGAGHGIGQGYSSSVSYAHGQVIQVDQSLSGTLSHLNGKLSIMYATNNADDDRVNYWSNSLFDGSNSNTNQPKLATDNTDVARLILERADDVAAFRPLPQLNASISGRWSVQANTYDVWTSNVSGGLPPYDYYWYRKNSGSSSYTYVGNGTSYGQTVTVDMDLKLVVIDDVNNSFTDYHSVDAISSGGSGCGPFTCPQPKLVGETIPESYSLSNNYPNPFNPSTKISFALPEQSNVELTIYNTMGQLVSTLQNGSLGEGSYEITFDAGALPSGLYIARLSAIGSSGESFINEIKMQLVK